MQKNDGYIILESSYSAKPEIVSDKCDITIIKTILQEAERPNRNKRIYSKRALQEAIARPMVQEKLAKKTLVGEAGHPLEETLQRQTNIDQRNISHIITSLNWDGDLLKGVVESANTAAGKDFQGLIRQGMEVAFSMRGVGGVVSKKDGYDFIDNGLHILTWDWVIFPSHDKAYQEAIMKEGKEFDVNFLNSHKVLTEGHLLPFDKKELSLYIAEKSDNVKRLAENTGFQITKDNINIDKNSMFSIREGKNFLKVYLEDNLKREVDNYLLHL